MQDLYKKNNKKEKPSHLPTSVTPVAAGGCRGLDSSTSRSCVGLTTLSLFGPLGIPRLSACALRRSLARVCTYRRA